MSVVDVPQVDPRVEFWSNQSYWPRDASGVGFIGRIVLHLGDVMFGKMWTGLEPQTILVHAIRRQLSAETPAHDIEHACYLLFERHLGYRQRTDGALARGDPRPLPMPDEWAVAYALSAQIEDQTRASLNRYCDVIDVLMRLFERGIVRTGLRPFLAGEVVELPRGEWFNECYPAWFATCQINPEFRYDRMPFRYGGLWIYVDLETYLNWLAIAFDSVGQSKVVGPGQTNGPPATAPSAPTASAEAASSPTSPTASSVDNSSKPSVSVPTSASTPTKKGAPERYRWPEFDAEVVQRANANSAPKSIHKFAGVMAIWCAEIWRTEPADSTLRKRIKKVLLENGLHLVENPGNIGN